jgi:hypothetical protein
VRSALLQLAAHGSTRNDLMATNSPILLGLRDEAELKTANIARPEEATKIVGCCFATATYTRCGDLRWTEIGDSISP